MSKQYTQYEINGATFCPTTQSNGRERGIKQNRKSNRTKLDKKEQWENESEREKK